ncbi:integral membrane protein, interacts with FtsH (plasmid) [Phenylobacterium zucineum HLK1]|jgi:FtsH-binding integral membrane protein|uniref:Integral membrane protein, interacts with FtsH n=1 Tax=Phenylobacterium zucineum (strain HLK1) TaxID=450851 RepID=B4RI77_PHEZH|nr:Bax inhibitor-1/YccA family protein [Phenylobacterium zucineum]ACG80052.1 integral membrane protein, interacts with FtsH [Phenylobacterium zucineum HLK1]
MSDFYRSHYGSIPAQRGDMAVDAGLRSFMIGVYNKVALGLVVSAALAFLTSSVPPIRDLMFMVNADGRLAGMTPLGWIVAFAPLGIMLVSGFAMKNPTSGAASALYWTIVALIGASFGVVGLMYTGTSIASTFLITATAFGGLSLFGYTTKKDLSGFGSFLIVGVIGLVIASLVNIFLRSEAVQFAVSVIGVFVFAGLIAYDTQRLKLTYYELGGDASARGVATSYGALSLYINFINLFQFLLSLFGQRRD